VKLERRVRQETVEKLKVQLYETTKEEEIAAMKAEIQRYEGIVSDYETQELELLEEVDQKKAEVQDQDQVVKDRKVYHAEMIEEFKEKARVFVERFKEAKLDRNQAAGKVASESLNLYERIYKSKGDVAVVELRGDVCSGCNMKVVPNTLATLRAGKELTQCENCGRILFEV